MKKQEQEALIKYLEFLLGSMIEELSPHVEWIVKQEMYDKAIAIVYDMNDTLNLSNEMKVKSTPQK